MIHRGDLFTCDVCGKIKFIPAENQGDEIYYPKPPKGWSTVNIEIDHESLYSQILCENCITMFKDTIKSFFYGDDNEVDDDDE